MWSRMTDALFREMVEAAALSYRRSGPYAWHFAKGKLGGDPVFRFLLRPPSCPPPAACWTWDADREC